MKNIYLVSFAVMLICFMVFQDVKYFYPVIILSVLSLVKVKLIKKQNHLEFKQSISQLRAKRDNVEQQTHKMKDKATELEKEIAGFSGLYELSEDIEKVISPNIIIEKSLEAICLKVDVEQLAFYSKSDEEWKVSYTRNIDNVSARYWLKKLENIKNSPGESFLKFYLEGKTKKSGLIILKVKEKENFTSRQIKEVSVLVNQMSLGYEKAVLYEEVKELSRIDGLTGLYLRRYFLERLSEELKRGKRDGYKVAFLMCDLDDFKKYNDTFGHPMGDKLLSEVSRIIKDNIYSSDFAGRYGGEEFCIYMPRAEKGGTLSKAQKIRKYIQRNTPITISLGISYFPEDGETIDEIIKSADGALYQAKESGKNKICQSKTSCCHCEAEPKQSNS